MLSWYEWENTHKLDHFIFGGVTPISRDKLTRHLKKHCKLTGVKLITNHEFRHSCISFLHSLGIPFPVISKYVRHAKISQTSDTYTHVSENDTANLMNVLNTL